ncbi:MAG: SLC13 family permease [Gammaproteobacteria bacterium]|nr:SLC13 family permease [Gammaproteobacteria bacterium]
MNFDQVFLFGLLILIFSFLLWGRIRYDIVTIAALFIAFVAGVIPHEDVFSGFSHPATVIVALVLIVSRGLSNLGAIELLSRFLVDGSRKLGTHIGLMSAIAAALSAMMNNVATLALLMPVDMQAAGKAKRSPALTLMPLSFATILGGMVTLIGTPTNVVIATFREKALGEPYQMFDFTPVGMVVSLVGILFVATIGWRLIPLDRSKHNTREELMDMEGYIAEAIIQADSRIIDMKLRDLDEMSAEYDVNVLGLVRQGKRLPGTARNYVLRENDILVLEAGPDAIEQFVGAAGLKFIGTDKQASILSENLALIEVVVPESALIKGRSALDLQLLYRQGVTLLGVSRKGKRFRDRVRKLEIRAGDILLLLGPEDQLPDVVTWLGCLPLAERGLQIIQRHKAILAVGLFALAIIVASIGWLYLPVALMGVVVAYVLLKIIPLSQIYSSVEWPVIVLLACLIPISTALETNGGTALVAHAIVELTQGLSPVVVLTVIMLITMTMSDVLNNVGTALIAAPISVDIAQQLNVNPDSFLMAVAVAASCAFLTPIGHKNNTIIMGPGGYSFGDYWRMGLPLEILVVLVGIPAILVVWPL